MAKILSVYLSDHDLELLHGLQTILEIPEEGTALKFALKHLANDHMHGQPAPGRVEEGLRVEVPAMVQIRAMVRDIQKELNREKAQAEAHRKREQAFEDWLRGKGEYPA